MSVLLCRPRPDLLRDHHRDGALPFVRRRVDAAVLEVGLGGRLDSTNVCTPCVSIITSISFDHMKQLGGTLAAIAAEKAGIIKPGVPVVSGVVADEPRDVIRRVARQNGCRLAELGVDFDFNYHPPRHLERAASPARFDFIYPRPRFGKAATSGRGHSATTGRGLASMSLEIIGPPPGRQRRGGPGGGRGTAAHRLDDSRRGDWPRIGRRGVAGAGGSGRAAAGRGARRRP